MRKIGGLWKHKSKDKGIDYLGGEIEIIAGLKTRVTVFKAKDKKNPKSPDYVVYVSDGVNNSKESTPKVVSEDVF